ncbi:hypothetical protein Acr_03g0003450 [Actinidia rufa]|uniref:Uncharacterized protein n=1 Tax=Actinidia rufa TaxID=165716 RepID=A0A7J0EAR6_9ERIC|nr:hypothetical protein Acr_03g0003450 [Actinidia rufa]
MEFGACSRVLNGIHSSYFSPNTRFQQLCDLSSSPNHSSNVCFRVSTAIRRGDCRCRAIVKDSSSNLPVEKVDYVIISLIPD